MYHSDCFCILSLPSTILHHRFHPIAIINCRRYQSPHQVPPVTHQANDQFIKPLTTTILKPDPLPHRHSSQRPPTQTPSSTLPQLIPGYPDAPGLHSLINRPPRNLAWSVSPLRSSFMWPRHSTAREQGGRYVCWDDEIGKGVFAGLGGLENDGGAEERRAEGRVG